MLVCHCMAVYERDVREEIDNGARDAFDIAEACDAGTVCGGCVPTICDLLDQARRPRRSATLTRRLIRVGDHP